MEKSNETPEYAPPPGEVIESYDGDANSFAYMIRRVANSEDLFRASTPYRHIIYCGATKEEAVGCMLRGVAELARDGSMDPDDPKRPGVPPLQHVMSILSDSLDWHIARRREQIEFLRSEHEKTSGSPVDTEPLGSARLTRLNEIISGLATGIAALARVKDL